MTRVFPTPEDVKKFDFLWAKDPDGNPMRRAMDWDDDSECCMCCKHFEACSVMLEPPFIPTADTYALTCRRFVPFNFRFNIRRI